MTKNASKQSWHSKARAFHKHLHESYEFSPDEAQVVSATVSHLSTYWKATDQLDAEGLTTTSESGMVRSHPANVIAKTAWAGFLSGLRLLGVCQPHEQKNPVGRPAGSWYS